MSGIKLEIQWSPVHNDKFITWGTEIYLYEVQKSKYISPPCIKISDNNSAKLLESNSSLHYVKCVDIYRQPSDYLLLAVGQANGKVVLTSFGLNKCDSLGYSKDYKEYVQKHSRQCNSIVWNPNEYTLVAAGFEKYRTENSILVWDIAKCPFVNDIKTNVNSFYHPNQTFGGAATTTNETHRPVYEMAPQEIAHSLSWSKTQPRTMVAGMNMKQIKIFDLRDPMKKVLSTVTKAVLGCCLNPYNENQLASYLDNQIYLWDTRYFEKPTLCINQNKNILKMLWSPTRSNLLGSLQRDSTLVNIHDIQHTIIGGDEEEPSTLERSVLFNPNHYITSFSWHPFNENRLITITLNGITDYTFLERITLNWAPSCKLLWNCGRSTFKFINEKNPVYNSIEDISLKIKQRSFKDYGLKKELWVNGDLADDPMLKSLWEWLYLSKCLVEEGSIRGYNMSKHPGVCQVLRINEMSNNTKFETVTWTEMANIHSSIKIYRSEDRDKALYLCGWRFDKNDTTGLKIFLDRLELENLFSKAAAIAIFNLKLKTGIEILNRGADKSQNSNLSIVAMALAGFSDEKNSLWRSYCQNSFGNITDPYLRATFSFLTCDNDNFDKVLNETGISVEDRVAFGCMYLSDNKLADFLRSLTDKLIEEGNLAGILLTGTCLEGLEVLQKYLDHTSDVQSVSLIAVKAFPPDLLTHPAVQNWISSYRCLLDSWHLWKQRALFDINLNDVASLAPTSNEKFQAQTQVYVCCNYCCKNISQSFINNKPNQRTLSGGSNPSNAYNRITTTTSSGTVSSIKPKLTACPNCRKPLPRCAICLMHMGTAAGYSLSNDKKTSPENIKLMEYSSWFTWCQTCRHGGHASHIANWFKEYSECPVTACTCRCFSVDVY